MSLLLASLAGAATTVAGGVAVNRADAAFIVGYTRLNRQLENARRAEKLPANHHIERGTVRAILVSTQVCIQQLKDSNRAAILNDVDQEIDAQGVATSENLQRRVQRSSFAACSALQISLNNLIRDLEPTATEERSQRKQIKLDAAYNKGKISISSTTMDALAGKGLSLINLPTHSENSSNTDTVSQSIRIAFGEFYSELENAIVQQVLNFGRWAPHRRKAVAAGLRDFLFGSDELWLHCFALSYAAELRQDKFLYRMAVFLRIERLQDAIDKSNSGIDSIRKEASAFYVDTATTLGVLTHQIENIISNQAVIAGHAVKNLDQLTNRLSFNKYTVFYPPSIGSNNSFHATLRPFYFAEEEDEFIGRDDVLELLDNKLLTPNDLDPDFKWAVICGEAGTGKSRLAFHILKMYSSTWRLSGFVRREFISNVELALTSLINIDGPSLFVVDYAGSAPEACCRFIEKCASLVVDAPFSVRVIVLLRRSNDRFFEFINDQIDGAGAVNTQIRFDPPEGFVDQSGALFLNALKNDETVELMRSRINRAEAIEKHFTGKSSTQSTDNEKLLSQLRHYDTRMRPLFAIMVAEAFQRGNIAPTAKQQNQEESRLALFREYLRHEFTKKWKAAPGIPSALVDKDKDKIDRHVSFVILSTMCRGLMDEGWKNILDEPKLFGAAKIILPHSPSVIISDYGDTEDLLDEEHLLSTLTGSQERESDKDSYPILEPDLIGETLALCTLTTLSEAKGFSLHNAVTQRRMDYLRKFAWLADPEGTAFFSILTAQDYPERAANLRWFLTDQMGPDPKTRGELFRNLVLVYTEPFGSRAATLQDVKRIAKLIDAFPSVPTDPVETQLNIAVGTSQIAQHLSFIVNKYQVPEGVDYKPSLADKLGKRQLAFGRAAADHGVQIDDENSLANSEFVYKLHSDEAAVELSLDLLRQLYDSAVEPAFESGNLEIRSHYAKVIKAALSTVFWVNRDDEEKLGFAKTSPTDEELEEFQRLTKHCESILETDYIDEDTLAVVSDITQLLIYAENGAEPKRGQKVFEAIKLKLAEGGFGSDATISHALTFLGNHCYNDIQAEINKEDINEREDLIHYSQISVALVKKALELPRTSEEICQKVVSSYCNVCSRISYYDLDHRNSSMERHIEYLNVLSKCADFHGIISVDDNIIDFFSYLLDFHNRDEQETTLILNKYSRLVDSCRFDQQSLNRPGWKNLRYHYLQLSYSQSISACSTENLFTGITKNIGARANRDLVDMLRYQLPDSKISADVCENLARVGTDCDVKIVSNDQREELFLALASQYLLCGDEDQGFNDLELHWSELESQLPNIPVLEYSTGLATLFTRLQLFVLWYGLDHPRVQVWRSRVLNFIHAKTPTTKSPPSKFYLQLSRDCVNVTATFANLEIFDGRDPEDWLGLQEAHS